MSAANWFVGVGLFAVAASLGTLAYRYERTGEVKKIEEKPSVAEGAGSATPQPFGPVPHVTVNAMQATCPDVVPAPVTVSPPTTAPTPVPVHHKRPAHKAVKKLKSEWSSNEKSAFDQMKDMFQ